MIREIVLLVLAAAWGFIACWLFFPRRPKESEAAKPLRFEPPAIPTAPEPGAEESIWIKEELAFLFRLNEKVSLAFEKELVARYIVEDLRSFLNVRSCALFLWDDSRGVLKLEFALGVEEDMLKEFFLLNGESISGEVFQKRQPLLINDLERDYRKAVNRESYLMNSFISVPLLAKGEPIGVLNVANKRSAGMFAQRDLNFLVNVARAAASAFQNSRLHERIQEEYLKTITALAVIIDARDSYTQQHSQNVTRYSVAIAKKMGLDPEQVEMIRRAALLHDIGKIGVRDDVLLKPERLNAAEQEHVKIHAEKGCQILQGLPFLRDVSLIVRHHHERFDGNGYPDNKKGDSIELGSRILAVADSYDAMTTDRPYRKGLPQAVAKEELEKNKGSQFDPFVVDCFSRVLNEES